MLNKYQIHFFLFLKHFRLFVKLFLIHLKLNKNYRNFIWFLILILNALFKKMFDLFTVDNFLDFKWIKNSFFKSQKYLRLFNKLFKIHFELNLFFEMFFEIFYESKIIFGC